MQKKPSALSNSWNNYHEVVIPEVFYVKTMVQKRTWECKFVLYLLIYSNKLAYLQLKTVLVYRTIPPKSHEQDYLHILQRPWKIRMNKFIFRTCNLTKNEVFLRYFSMILFNSFRGSLLRNTSLYICSNSKYVVHGLLRSIMKSFYFLNHMFL